MKTRILHPVLPVVLVALLLAAPGARANGFFIQEMSAAGLGQAMALVAEGGRPTSQYQNAANLSFMDGLWLEASATLYMFDGQFENLQGDVTKIVTPTQVVPSFFASYRINDWLAVGLAEFTAFGLSMEWPEDWEGRHLAIRSAMQTFTINPNISFGPFKGFAIAAGFNAMYGSFSIKRALTLGMNPPGDTASNTVELGASAWGFGGNVGLMYQPADWVRIGLAYRSGIKIKADDGKMDYDVSQAFASRFPDQKFKAEIDLPHIVMGGVRFWPMKELSIEFDVQWVQWSSYDELRFELSKGLVLGPNARQMTLVEKKDYHDAVQLRLGMEYKFYKDMLALRLGFLWDQNPVPDKSVDPMLPDTQRLMPCIAFGGIWKGIYLDVGYMPVFALPRKAKYEDGAPLAGNYTSITHDVTLTLGYHWGGPKKK